MSDKEAVLKLVKKLPANVSLQRISEEIEMLRAIAAGEEDLRAGRVLRDEQVWESVDQWLKTTKSSGRSERTGNSSKRQSTSRTTVPKQRRSS